MRKRSRGLLMLFFLFLSLLSVWQVYQIKKEYRAGADTYSELVSDTQQLPEVPEQEQPNHIQWPSVDFESLREINQDIVAWLFIEGTRINYPVVQGSDNSYYLDHLFDKTGNGAGCLFLDARVSGDFGDKNSVIYGHYMKNGTMFAGLHDYKQQQFYDAHPTALLLTPHRRYQVLFFSGYVADVSNKAWEDDFSREAFEQWVSQREEKSLFDSGFQPTEEDRVLTLSTCSYEFRDARFVLHGILEEHP